MNKYQKSLSNKSGQAQAGDCSALPENFHILPGSAINYFSVTVENRRA